MMFGLRSNIKELSNIDFRPAMLPPAEEFSPQLVLVDLVLPAASGMDVLEAIRKDPDIGRPDRVVLMTGHANPVPDKHHVDLGMDKVLPKPFKLEQLKTALFN